MDCANCVLPKVSGKKMCKTNYIIVTLSVTLGACVVFYFLFERPGLTVSGRLDPKPHIIVIMADDMGWNDVSYHGSNQIPTPNIDALAYNGVILDKHYVLPVCTPSRTAYLTGKYPIRTGMQGKPLSVAEPRAIPLNFTLLPNYLRDLGYATHLVGKWHVGYFADRYLPTYRGFDTFFGCYSGYMRYFTYIIEDFSMGFPGYDLHRDVAENCTADYTPKNVYATDLFTNEAENIIANHDPDVPLYLHFSHVAPHTSGFTNGYEVRDVREVNETFGYITDDSRRLYAGMVSALDDSIGRVVEALGKKGILNDSIILFLSDNGAQTVGNQSNAGSNYPYRGLKFSLFEGGVHTPALIWSPMIENASRIHEDYLHVTDWLPTFYNLAGGDVEDLGPIDGVDQWDAIAKGTRGPRDSMLLNLNERTRSGGAVKGRFKYLTGAREPYGFYFGDNVDDGDSSAPPYNATSIINSMAGLAIANATGNTSVGSEAMLDLRRANKVLCAPHTVPSNCTASCLFDLAMDPCETSDVSAENPDVVAELDELLAEYWKVSVPRLDAGIDYRAFPSYEGGPWLPWLSVDGRPVNCP